VSKLKNVLANIRASDKSFLSSRVPLEAHHAHSSFLMSEQHAFDHDQKQAREHKFRHNHTTVFT